MTRAIAIAQMPPSTMYPARTRASLGWAAGIASATTYTDSDAPPMLTPELPHTRIALATNATTNVTTRVATKCPLTSVARMAVVALAAMSAAIAPARVLYDPPRSDSAPLKPPRLIHVAAPERSSSWPTASGITVASEARKPAAYAGRALATVALRIA